MFSKMGCDLYLVDPSMYHILGVGEVIGFARLTAFAVAVIVPDPSCELNRIL